MKKEPKHHKQYRFIWEAFIDPDTPEDLKIQIGFDMDAAQAKFKSKEEFNKFKKTLDGYEEYWKNLVSSLLKFKEVHGKETS